MNQFAYLLNVKHPRAAILMRHAERGHFNHPAEGASVPITPKGAIDAEVLGRALARWECLDLSHSPVGRCRQTAEAIGRGALTEHARVTMRGEEARLGGPYMLNVPAALDKAGELGSRFVREWFDGRICPSLFKSRGDTALEQLTIVDAQLSAVERGLAVLVTHDWNLLAVREEVFGMRHEDDRWPGFLDGMVIWRSSEGLHVACGNATAMLQQNGSHQ